MIIANGILGLIGILGEKMQSCSCDLKGDESVVYAEYLMQLLKQKATSTLIELSYGLPIFECLRKRFLYINRSKKN